MEINFRNFLCSKTKKKFIFGAISSLRIPVDT